MTKKELNLTILYQHIVKRHDDEKKEVINLGCHFTQHQILSDKCIRNVLNTIREIDN